MKLLCLAFLMLTGTPAFAHDGSWFGVGGNYEHLASGPQVDGASVAIEGGYWYLGNVSYGGSFKASFLGDKGRPGASDIHTYDIGAFWKAGSDAGLYGKLLAGMEFFSGDRTGLNIQSASSFYIGLGGGFLFPVSDTFQIGPEVLYRHLTAGDGANEISVGILVTYGF